MPSSSSSSARTPWVERGLEWLCQALAAIAFVIFSVEALMTVASVAGRALFSAPIPGDYELVQMMTAAAVALCLPYCELRRGHVFVNFFTLRAPAWFNRTLDALSTLLLAAVAFFLAWRSWVGMWEMREYAEASMVLGLPIWWGYIPLTPALSLLGVVALMNVRRLVMEEIS